MEDNRNKALLVVSFGTTDPAGRKNSIESVENALREACPGRRFYRAWTSGMVISILSKRGEHLDSLDDAILRMKEDGISDVLVQPTHILPGMEYEKILAAFGMQKEPDENSAGACGFERVRIGRPLISDAGDIEKLTSALLEIFPVREEKELYIFAGHGTWHKADELYRKMEDAFHKAGAGNVIFVTLEGPMSITEKGGSGRVLSTSQLGRIRHFDPAGICLVPFLLVCGEHARKDIGGEEADSLLSLLQQAGYDTRVVMKGLGEYPLVRNIFAEHLCE